MVSAGSVKCFELAVVSALLGAVVSALKQAVVSATGEVTCGTAPLFKLFAALKDVPPK